MQIMVFSRGMTQQRRALVSLCIHPEAAVPGLDPKSPKIPTGSLMLGDRYRGRVGGKAGRGELLSNP